jgi:hypothetical protein
MTHSRNPLYPNFSGLKSRANKIVRDLKKQSALASVMTATGIDRDMKNMRKNNEVTKLISSAKSIAEQYAKGGKSRQAIQRLMSRMGPAGDLMGMTIKNEGQVFGFEKELSLMESLLKAFGIGKTKGRKTKKPISESRALRTIREMNRQVERAIGWLEHLGVEVPGSETEIQRRRRERRAGAEEERRRRRERRKPEVILPQGQETTTQAGKPRRYVDVKVDGVNKRFPISHPIITGEMVPVSSSNVHSFGYDLDERRLYIRFLGGTGKKRSGPGPIYAYSPVPGVVFLAFIGAASAGKFVWKHIRIPHTLEHRYDYQLIGVTGSHVPRKAQPSGYYERELLTSEGETLRSKPTQLFGRSDNPYTLPKIQNYSRGAPAPINRAAPNRAAPNRGAPNRG